MKLKSHKTTRVGDKVSVEALWHSKFKKPLGVSVQLDKTAPSGSSPGQLMEGDVLDVHGFLFGAATIAWYMGWRPAGFMKAMDAWITDYKPKS